MRQASNLRQGLSGVAEAGEVDARFVHQRQVEAAHLTVALAGEIEDAAGLDLPAASTAPTILRFTLPTTTGNASGPNAQTVPGSPGAAIAFTPSSRAFRPVSCALTVTLNPAASAAQRAMRLL